MLEKIVWLNDLPVKELSLIMVGFLFFLGISSYIKSVRKRSAEYYLDTPHFSQQQLRKIALAKDDHVEPIASKKEISKAKSWFRKIEENSPDDLIKYNHAYNLQKEIAFRLKDNWWDNHQRLLNNSLHWLSSKVFKEKSASDSSKNLSKYFTSESYQFCLKLTLIYPIFFAVINILFDGSLKIAQWSIISYASTNSFIVMLITLVSIIALAALEARTESNHEREWVIGAMIVIILFAPFKDGAFTIVAILSFFFFFNSIGKNSVSGPILVAAFISVFAVSVSVFSALSIVGVFNDLYTSVAIAFGIIFTFIFTVIVLKTKLNRLQKGSSTRYFHTAQTVVWLFFSLICVSTILIIGQGSSFKMIFLPLIALMLPVLNAPIDWISLNITRWLLSKIQQHHHNVLLLVVYGFLDLILAVAFVFLLTAIILITVIGVNHLAFVITGRLLIEFDSLMADIVKEPKRHLWLHLMVLSTLVPTILHFVLVLYSFISWPLVHWGKPSYRRLYDHTSEKLGRFRRDRATIMLTSRLHWFLTLIFLASVIFLLQLLHEAIYTVAGLLWQWADWILTLDPVYKRED